MHITVLSGGVGGAKFLLGVREFARRHGHDVTAIVNTGDDITLHGLRICPDLDSVMYTLAGAADTGRGWGRADETWRISDQLAEYGMEPNWFSLGDLDISTHLVRTQLLAAGQSLTQVTARLCQRWDTGITVLPMTDQPCETHVLVEQDGGRRSLHFQQWWVQYRASLPALAFEQRGLEQAALPEAVSEALARTDITFIAPSNPVVSINTILSVPGMTAALRNSPGPVVGLSPIIAGAPVRGMADRCLPVLEIATTAQGVGSFYGARSAGGILDGWLISDGDAAVIAGVQVLARHLMMDTPDVTAGMVEAALGLVRR